MPRARIGRSSAKTPTTHRPRAIATGPGPACRARARRAPDSRLAPRRSRTRAGDPDRWCSQPRAVGPSGSPAAARRRAPWPPVRSIAGPELRSSPSARGRPSPCGGRPEPRTRARAAPPRRARASDPPPSGGRQSPALPSGCSSGSRSPRVPQVRVSAPRVRRPRRNGDPESPPRRSGRSRPGTRSSRWRSPRPAMDCLARAIADRTPPQGRRRTRARVAGGLGPRGRAQRAPITPCIALLSRAPSGFAPGASTSAWL